MSNQSDKRAEGHPVPPVVDFHCFFAYDVGESKAGNTVVVADAIISAIRLAREDRILNMPKAVATISDSLALARAIYDKAAKSYPELFRD